jgi:hypothetical protein
MAEGDQFFRQPRDDALSPAIQFWRYALGEGRDLCDAHYRSEPSNRHGLSVCHEYNPTQVRWFMLATAQFGAVKSLQPGRRDLILSHTAHFWNALDALVPSAAGHGRRPHTASLCRLYSAPAQTEISVCSDMAQTCWVAIPKLSSNGHRRERPIKWASSRTSHFLQ